MYLEERVVETGFSFSNDVPQPPDRRTAERHIKILRVGTIVVDGRRELCLIRNISAGGVMAHVYSQLTPGQPVSIELKTSQPVTGRVVWTRGGNAGVQFDASVDVAELLAAPQGGDNAWRPRTPRVEIDRMATLRCGARTAWVHARDISQSGVKIEAAEDEAPKAGEAVVITLEGFRPIAGVVRWSADGCCGINFNGLIPFGDLIDWLKQN
ncbi:PilZ domain-containing protein [Allosphingosinicella sp.]|uniref:PilZ domain-containing protein n=1 Tax=Allosphingosinicella sp. TaxID=2823234 RepID=UPI0037837E4C